MELKENVSGISIVSSDSLAVDGKAGFWWRSLAALIDVTLFVLFLLTSLFLIKLLVPSNIDIEANLYIDLVVLFTTSMLYYPLSEASMMRGTIGKKILKIYIGNKHGQRMSVLTSFARHALRIISGLFYMIGFVVCGITTNKQGAHDYFTKTYVYRVRQPIRTKAGSPKPLILASRFLNGNSTKLVAMIVMPLTIGLLSVAVSLASFSADVIHAHSAREKISSSLMPVKKYIEGQVAKKGSFPDEIPEHVKGSVVIDQGIYLQYLPDSGGIQITFDTLTGSLNENIIVYPKVSEGGIRWLCKGKGGLAKYCPEDVTLP